jgi:type IV fimbrial biogenesis protein FimT
MQPTALPSAEASPRLPQRPVPRPHGFTLLEALIVMAVVTILLALAVPAFGNARAAAHAGAARAALLDSLMTASSHAAVTATHVVLCASRDGASCSGDPDWSHGWLAFADLDGNRIPGPHETLLRRQPALDGSARLRSTVGRTRLVFQPNGGNAGSNVTFTLCDRRGPAHAVSLVLANDGRLRSGKPAPAAVKACVDTR